MSRASVFDFRDSGFWVLGFAVEGSGFRVQDLGCRVQGAGFRVWAPCEESVFEGVDKREVAAHTH